MSMFKRIMLAVVILGALLLAAVLVFVSTFDINEYKDNISHEVEKRTGRTLVFDDDLQLAVFPTLAIDMGRVSLSNRAGFGDGPMVRINSASVRVRLLPLLTGDVEFGVVTLDGLVVRLERDARGTTNWGDLAGGSRGEITEEGTSTRLRNELVLDLAGVEITNAGLVWEDGTSGVRHTLTGLSLKTDAIQGGQPFSLSLAFELASSEPEMTSRFHMDGSAALIPGRRGLRCSGLTGRVEAEGPGVPGGKGDLDFSLESVDIDMGRGYIAAEGLKTTAYGISSASSLRVEGLSGSTQRMTGQLSVAPFNLQETLAALGREPLALKNPQSLTRVGGSTKFAIMAQSVAVSNLDLMVDNTTVVGNGRILRVDDRPEYSFLLGVGDLNLDDYMPVKSEQPEAEPQVMPVPELNPDAETQEADGTSSSVLPVEMLRDLVMDGEVRINRLTVAKATLEQIICTVKARDGLVRVSPFNANAYGGTISSGLTLNLLNTRPSSDVILALKQVNVGTALNDVLGRESLSGIGDLSGAMSFQGDVWEDIRRTLNGKATFSLTDGVFPGVDIMGLIASAEARRRQSGTSSANAAGATKFGQATGSVNIKNGVVGNRDLDLRAPGLRVGGEGFVDLRNYDVDYTARVKLVPSSEGQGGPSGDDLYGVTIPVQINGTVLNPKYFIDPTEYAKMFGEAVKDTVGGVVDGVQKLLKGFIK